MLAITMFIVAYKHVLHEWYTGRPQQYIAPVSSLVNDSSTGCQLSCAILLLELLDKNVEALTPWWKGRRPRGVHAEMHRVRTLLKIIIFATVFIFPLASLQATVSQTPSATPEPVVREVFVAGDPDDAPNDELQLVQYTIQPGTTLPAHTHPGMQIATIKSGVLHYVVVRGGKIEVTRAGGDATPAATEWLGPGQETDLHPGDSVIETEHVVHYGANLSDEPVVILAATLLASDQPAAIPFDLAATPSAGQ